MTTLAEQAGTGLEKEKLLLRATQCLAQRFGDPKVLNAAMVKLLGADLFCICEPYLVGEGIFGFQKHEAMFFLVLRSSHTSQTK
jgi:hypothetical protein